MKHIIQASALSALFADKSNNGGEFTVRSLKTNKDYTFKVATKMWKGKSYTHVSVEKNYLEWSYLGTFFNGRIFSKSGQGSTPSALAIAYLLTKVQEEKFDLLDSQVEVTHLGNCVRCGRILTDATSIARGLGSECVKYVKNATLSVA
jgi:hypothetical protein